MRGFMRLNYQKYSNLNPRWNLVHSLLCTDLVPYIERDEWEVLRIGIQVDEMMSPPVRA